MKLNSKLLGGASFALVALAVAAPAQAQTVPLYSGGGTLAEKVYRDIFNCYGNSGATDAVDATRTELEIGLAGQAQGCNGVTGFNENVEAFYVGVGSGNGLTSFVTHTPSHFLDGTATSPKHGDKPPVPSASGGAAFGPFYGTGVGTNWTPDNNTNTAYAGSSFPKVSFVGSDDPLTATKLASYDAAHWGAPIQFPAFITTIAVPYSPAAGTWTEKGKDLHTQGASGKVQLSLNTMCGIFTGAITDWSDAEIKADNANVQLGSGTIHVTVRGDGSGSTFLFTNALIHQCGSQSNPRTSTVGGITITHPVPDQWLTDNSISNTGGANAIGASNNNFFININTAGHLPANFTTASGSTALKTAINTNAGSIGYISPDFTQNGKWIAGSPGHLQQFDTTGPKAANIQSFASFDTNVAKAYKVAGYLTSTTAIMATAKAPLFTAGSCAVGTGVGQASDGICAHNALNWGVANPMPSSAGAYPIGGFTFIDMYTCYASASDVTALVSPTAGSLGLWRWYFGSTTENSSHVKNELQNNGFGLVPSGWISGAKKLLLTDLKTKVGTPGQAKTGCTTVSTGA